MSPNNIISHAKSFISMYVQYIQTIHWLLVKMDGGGLVSFGGSGAPSPLLDPQTKPQYGL